MIVLEIGGNGADVTESFNRMALELGADESMIAAEKEGYERAEANLTAAAEANDVEVTQMYADSDGIYLVKTSDEPENYQFAEMGVDYTEVNTDGDFYWDIFSWENVSQMMTGDVLLVSEEGMQEDELKQQATFAEHPALQAGQIYTWETTSFDYKSRATQMDKLAEILEESESVQ